MCLGEQIRLVLSRIGKSTRIENLVSIGIPIKIGVVVFSVDSKYNT
jgi:UDP-3-O-[3-hydroxymyristoyl] glucosamine N-acyltransferase